MKALVYTGPKKAEVLECKEPIKSDGKIKIDIKYCGVCGSDIGIFLGTHPRAKAPLILGHEFLGIVAENGRLFKKGDRVVAYPLISCHHCLACRNGNEHVCNTLKLIGIDTDGGMAQTIYVDENILFKVPEQVSDKAAVTVEPLAVLVHALHMVDMHVLDTAVISGAGPIGLLCGLMLKHAGADKVFISDVAEKRLAIAEQLNLTPVNLKKENLLEVVKKATDNEGCDVFFECSGAADPAMQMSEITRVRGRICIVAVHKAPHEVNLRDINFKEQTVVGTRVYTKDEFGKAVNLTAELEKDLEKIVTHIVPLSESNKVFDIIANLDNGSAKVVVDCQK
ncbi:zinc-dependent alcohol dehydrogenase [Pectinatus cerevisiiphilus]|uniref:Threonine dehydrogenase-like Zn-dependent dehydrogenase n=1 Tax=Pectinatus cerevisiiphilus TaxID=86956 RepID=A0A4R3KAI7_9FIRM|nr:alcohol dehydrogenase catalytic domain-containing protein [Pectinatus cerevisiiphilus]TCS80116.1 threonine dehydrogenase-like Zn-dependent dehydrogenase [Pectinatus cerevisiiphilus]